MDTDLYYLIGVDRKKQTKYLFSVIASYEYGDEVYSKCRDLVREKYPAVQITGFFGNWFHARYWYEKEQEHKNEAQNALLRAVKIIS